MSFYAHLKWLTQVYTLKFKDLNFDVAVFGKKQLLLPDKQSVSSPAVDP